MPTKYVLELQPWLFAVAVFTFAILTSYALSLSVRGSVLVSAIIYIALWVAWSQGAEELKAKPGS